MNILLLTAMFPPIRTGSSFYAQDLASAMTRRGHAVTVVTLKNRDASTDDFEFPVYRLDALHLENVFRKYFKHFRVCSVFRRNYRRVDDLIAARSIDIVLVVSHYHDIAFVAARCARKRGIPLVCTINTQLQMNNVVMRAILRAADRLAFGTFFLPHCKMIISLDREIERYLAETYSRRVVRKSVIIPYGCHGDPGPCPSRDVQEAAPRQLIGIGALIEQRNYLFSVAIFSRLSQKDPSLRFKIIGHIYYDAAARLVKRLGLEDKVIFTGELPHGKIMEEISCSLLYLGVFSGRYLGLGTATIEAMIAGIPVVSNAPPDLLGDCRLEDMDNYIFADVADPSGVVEKLGRVLAQKTLREKIGANGQSLVRENLDWGSIARKFENVLSAASGRVA